MHWAALNGAPDDPYVLARLGLYPLACAADAPDAKARIGRQLARVALGEVDSDALDTLSNLPPSMRRLAARLLALQDVEAAIDLLNGHTPEAVAACLLALDRPKDARLHLSERAGRGRETAALQTHIAVSAGEYSEARSMLNQMFAQDGLGTVIDAGGAPFTLDDLGGTAEPIENGPKVSIVIPYRDAEKTLETAIRSMADQSWRNIEIIAVDDSSSDAGPDIVQRMAAADERIVALSNTRAPGVYGARNSAIDAASGEYIAFLDADDWSPCERIARQLSPMRSHAVGIANHIRMDDTGRPVAPRVFPVVRPVPITLLTRRETLVSAGPFEEVATGADSEMLARLEMLHGKAAIHRDDAVLLVARWRAGSLSQAAEGGLLGMDRYAYRADWMFRHAGRDAPRLPGTSRTS